MVPSDLLLAGDIETNPGPHSSVTDSGGAAAGPRAGRRRSGGGGAAAEERSGRDGIRIVHQNVRSLRNKLGVLRANSAEIQQFDVAAFTETWLSDGTADSELQVGLPNHSWFRRDRPTHAGGVACAVCTSLSPVRRHDLEPDNTELLIVELDTTPKCILGVCYCPPSDDASLTRTMSALQSVTQRYPQRSIVIIGDFNLPDIRWSETTAGWARPSVARPSRRSQCFLDACALTSMRQFVWQTTRGDKTLDLVLSNQRVTDIAVRDGIFDSDHKEIECVIRKLKTYVPLVTRTSVFNYKEADFSRMRRSLAMYPWQVLDNKHVDEAVDMFYDVLYATVKDCIPTVQIKRKYPPWFDRELRTLLREKECAYRRMKRNRCEETEIDFRDKRSDFKTAANRKYSKYLVGLTHDFKTNPKRFWSFLKNVKSGNRNLSVLNVGGIYITDDKEKANALKAAFASKFSDTLSYCGATPVPCIRCTTICRNALRHRHCVNNT